MTLKAFRGLVSRKSRGPLPTHPVTASVAIAALVFVACIFGAHTRVLFSLASIWPANALLLGMLLIRPRTNTALTWVLVALAYCLADIVTGSPPLNAMLLTGANLAGVGAGLLAAILLRQDALPQANPSLDAIATIVLMASASAGAALGGALAGPLLFGMNWAANFGLWFSAEFVNHALFLPIVLALRSIEAHTLRFFSRDANRARHQMAALASLLMLVAAMHWIGGPLASVYLVPGILWCAVAYRPFAASMLTMLVCTWILIAGPLGLIPLRIDFSAVTDAASFRLGVGMVATGAFAVSIINAAWRQAHTQLRHVAAHDALTGLFNRGALIMRLAERLQAANPFTLVMLDIDRFKAINDSHGHPVGDRVLEKLAHVIRGRLRPGDFAGRLGGEEFALVFDAPLADGQRLAEDLRAAVAAATIALPGGESLCITVSMGLSEGAQGCDMSQLLGAADSALYGAKRGGRNRVVIASDAAGSIVTSRPQA